MNDVSELLAKQEEYNKLLKEAEKFKPHKLDMDVLRGKMPVARIIFDPADGFFRIKCGGSEIALGFEDLLALYKALGQLVVG